MREVYKVFISKTSEVFYCHSDEFVFDALRRSGSKTARAGCHGGGCGICKAKVITGEYRKTKPISRVHVTNADEENGFVLLCCIKPNTDMEIDVLKGGY